MAAPDMTSDTNLLIHSGYQVLFWTPNYRGNIGILFQQQQRQQYSEEEKDHPPSKKLCQPVNKSKKQSRSVCTHSSSSSSSTRSYLKKWEQEFTWLEPTIVMVHKRSPGKTGGIWTTKPFSNWKKAIEKLRAHAKSNAHIRSLKKLQCVRLVNRWDQLFNSFKQYQKERKANRIAVKSYFRCAHFLTKINSEFLIHPILRNQWHWLLVMEKL